MRKMMMFLAAMVVIAFTHMSTGVLAEGMKDPTEKTYEEMSLLIGDKVRNVEGEELGTVRDFIWDSKGKLSFAIVSHGDFLGFGGKRVAIPYSALTYDEDENYFTCAISKDRFAKAPEFEDEVELQERSFAEEVYRYFGQQPYWTEESMEASDWSY